MVQLSKNKNANFDSRIEEFTTIGRTISKFKCEIFFLKQKILLNVGEKFKIFLDNQNSSNGLQNF